MIFKAPFSRKIIKRPLKIWMRGHGRQLSISFAPEIVFLDRNIISKLLFENTLDWNCWEFLH